MSQAVRHDRPRTRALALALEFAGDWGPSGRVTRRGLRSGLGKSRAPAATLLCCLLALQFSVLAPRPRPCAAMDRKVRIPRLPPPNRLRAHLPVRRPACLSTSLPAALPEGPCASSRPLVPPAPPCPPSPRRLCARHDQRGRCGGSLQWRVVPLQRAAPSRGRSSSEGGRRQGRSASHTNGGIHRAGAEATGMIDSGTHDYLQGA